jgi:hypothetical protein
VQATGDQSEPYASSRTGTLIQSLAKRLLRFVFSSFRILPLSRFLRDFNFGRAGSRVCPYVVRAGEICLNWNNNLHHACVKLVWSAASGVSRPAGRTDQSDRRAF